MEALIAMYRLTVVDPAETVTLRMDSVCTSPALAMLRAHLHGQTDVFLMVEPAPIDAYCTLLHRHRFRTGTFLYVAYLAAHAPEARSYPSVSLPPPADSTMMQ